MKRMLRIAAGLALSACVIAFAGCKNLPTVQQTFSTACPIIANDLQVVADSPLVSADDQAKLNKDVIPKAKAICTAGGQLNVTNLKAFHDSLLPMAVMIVQAVPMLPDQTLILLALQTFGPLVQQQVDMLITAVTTPASAPTAASAPAAAASDGAATQ